MRLPQAALALALALIPTAASAAPLVIDSEVLLIGHGARPPTHEPALPPATAPDPWPSWPVPPGDLTPHGAQAIALLVSLCAATEQRQNRPVFPSHDRPRRSRNQF